MSVSIPDNKQPKHIHEYHEIELQEIFVKSRTYISLRVQIFSFIGTAKLTLLGIAFTSQKAILILFSASLMVLLASIDSMLVPVLNVLCARGLQIEKLYSLDKDSLMMSVILSNVSNKKKTDMAGRLREANTLDEIVKLLQVRSFNKLGIKLSIIIVSFEFVVGFILVKFNVLSLF